MREIDKARSYEAVNPGIDIPIEQMAERYDRKVIKQKYSGSSRRSKAVIGSITIPKADVWCGCGKLKGSNNCSCGG